MSDRIIRDEILRSHRFVGLSSDTLRLVFVAFVLCADDLGNAEATATAMGIMMVRHVPEDVAAKWLAELADVDLVRVYESTRQGDESTSQLNKSTSESTKKRYIHIPRFRQRLRYSSGKHPRPPANVECSEIKQLAHKVRPRSDHGQTTVRLKSAEVKRSEEKRSKTYAQPDGFAEFWLVYPKKLAKRSAVVAWTKIHPDPILTSEIVAAVRIQTSSEGWLKDAGQFIPYPATWLNGRRWEDEPTTQVKPKAWI